MKFSEAVLLGSVVIKPIPGLRITYHDKTIDGACALGMAEIAINKSFHISAAAPEPIKPSTKEVRRLLFEDWVLAEQRWPWLSKRLVILPIAYCRCFVDPAGPMISLTAVAHIFDSHVFGNESCTFEQLVDWIKSIEPEEKEVTKIIAEQEQVTCLT